MRILDDLERFARESPYPDALESIKEARTSIEKLINKMDTLEAGFDRIAERSRELIKLFYFADKSLRRNSPVIVKIPGISKAKYVWRHGNPVCISNR